MVKENYDYIIIGAGASGLLLADALGRDDFFSHKRVLVLDKQTVRTNDRTWCFWEQKSGDFDTILHKAWPELYVAGKDFQFATSINPYTYKMLKGIDFYTQYIKKINSYSNVTFLAEEVNAIVEKGNHVLVKTKSHEYTAERVFNSIFEYKKILNQQRYPVLQQHFLGWSVKTKDPFFKKQQATFMDFSVPQKGNTRFMYVLPFSETEALVEYTLFSEHTLEKEEYETAIKSYLEEKLGIYDYTITEMEQGNIPMTCFDFSKENSNHILNIGIAGGWAKPSTGFTFYNSTKKVKELVSHLKSNKPLSKFSKKNRFWYYDLLLLDILKKNNEIGHSIFESLFKNRKPQLILKFLDEDTNLWEELKIIWACPKLPFIKALYARLF